MTTGSKERISLFNLVSVQVANARSRERERLRSEQWGLDKLLRELVRQAPNRVHYSPDGKIGLVLFFKGGKQPYGAYFQASEQYGDKSRVLGSFDLEYPTLQQLEYRILGLRTKFQMEDGDLVNKPEFINSVHKRENGSALEFVHTSEVLLLPFSNQNNSIVYYRYDLGQSGPRALAIGRKTLMDLQKHGLTLTREVSVPPVMLDYAHPFPK